MICEHWQFNGDVKDLGVIELEEIKETEQKVFVFVCNQCPGWQSLEVPPELRHHVSPESSYAELRFSLGFCLSLRHRALAPPVDLVNTSPDASVAAGHGWLMPKLQGTEKNACARS